MLYLLELNNSFPTHKNTYIRIGIMIHRNKQPAKYLLPVTPVIMVAIITAAIIARQIQATILEPLRFLRDVKYSRSSLSIFVFSVSFSIFINIIYPLLIS